jgi:colanic acid biosynthesis glycosyl transferase WcaI
MRILVITAFYAPDIGPSAPIYTNLCEDLQRQGNDVTVVSGVPHYKGEYHPEYPNKLFQERTLNGVRVIRTYVYKVPRNTFFHRLIYQLVHNLLSTIAALTVQKPDVIIADAPFFWSGLSLLMTAIFRKVPFIYVVHDIYPDMFNQLGMIRNSRLLHIIGKIESFYYRKAGFISVLSEGFRQNLMRKGVPPQKLEIIPACVDTDFVKPLPKENKLRKKWGIEHKFVVLYAGNLGYSQALEELVQAAKLLMDYPNIVFSLVGEGVAKTSLQKMVLELGISNVFFYPFQPTEDMPDVYAMADVSIVSLKKDIVVESVPSKTYTILASGRPIIAAVDRETEVAHLIAQAQCGLYVEPGDVAALAEAILKLYNDPHSLIVFGEHGRDFVTKHYSRDVATNQYYRIVQKLAKV